jgi:hypothetical protein
MNSTRKRVTRTYGSKRVEAPPPDESPDADRSFGTLVDGDISISLSPAARSRGIDVDVVSSQDTKVDDDDDEGDDSAERPKHQWSWREMLKKLSESDEEAELAPALPTPQRPPDVDPSPSPPASRGRGPKSKGKRSSSPPRDPQRLPLITTHPDFGLSARVSVEPETNDGDGDRSPSLPSKRKRHTSGRMPDVPMIEDSESEAPRASSSKPRGGRFNSADVDANDRTSPDPVKRKRKTAAGRKPTAKVNYHDIYFVGSY